jgi:hypothetical protein
VLYENAGRPPVMFWGSFAADIFDIPDIFDIRI